MKRSSEWLLIVVLFSLVCGCSKKESTAAQPSNSDQTREAEPEEPVIKAATPEDPGPIARVILPLPILKGEAEPPPTKPEAEVTKESLSIDHPAYLQLQKPKKLLHKVFSISNHAQFTFLVPPHQRNTRLRGNFRSFTNRSDPASSSDRTASIDLMLLNEQEFNDFLHAQPQSVTYELDSVNNQSVDWWVPATYGEAQTYHLVFNNPAGRATIKFVEADFTVSFQ
jgi:hypothetical protein